MAGNNFIIYRQMFKLCIFEGSRLVMVDTPELQHHISWRESWQSSVRGELVVSVSGESVRVWVDWCVLENSYSLDPTWQYSPPADHHHQDILTTNTSWLTVCRNKLSRQRHLWIGKTMISLIYNWFCVTQVCRASSHQSHISNSQKWCLKQLLFKSF